MADIQHSFPGTGRRIKEDGTIVNIADLLEQIAKGGAGGGGATENPFSTAVGQSVVSINETFWARLIRDGGKYIMSKADGVAMTTTGNAVYSTSKSPNAGFVLYPKEIVVSSTVEALLLVRITPGTFTGYQPQTMLEYQFPVKARETQRVTFEGEMAVVGLGKIEIGYKNTSADGLFYGTIFGVEVANNA